MGYEIILQTIVFLYGIVIGSFLNVCIYRIPEHKNIALERSHCMSCNNQLRWYELVPVLSWVFLKGRCHKCKQKISIQYPLIELINGIGYVLIFIRFELEIRTLLVMLLFSTLLVISVIDLKTREIPPSLNLFILILGIINLIINKENWKDYIIGFFAVSLFLLCILIITKGRGIGGGDIKLMAVAGLFLGAKEIVLALILGCIIGSIIHIFLMAVFKKGRELAFGPYLSLGIFIAALYGKEMINWYLSYIGI